MELDAPVRNFPLADIGDSLYRAGRHFQRQKEYSRAIDCYCQLALQQAHLCENTSGQHYVMSMLGTLFKRTGTRRTQAHAYYLLARLAQDEADPRQCELYLDSMYTQLRSAEVPPDIVARISQ